MVLNSEYSVFFIPSTTFALWASEEDEIWEQVKRLQTSSSVSHQHHVCIELPSTKPCDWTQKPYMEFLKPVLRMKTTCLNWVHVFPDVTRLVRFIWVLGRWVKAHYTKPKFAIQSLLLESKFSDFKMVLKFTLFSIFKFIPPEFLFIFKPLKIWALKKPIYILKWTLRIWNFKMFERIFLAWFFHVKCYGTSMCDGKNL